MADEAHLKSLMLRGLAGDEAAHCVFLTEAAALLRIFFRNRLRTSPEDAEDLVQETLIALHTRGDSYDPHYPLMAWIYAIARYRLIDFTRRAKHRNHVDLDGIEVGNLDPEYEASDSRRDILSLLSMLPEKQQRAIYLVKLEGKSIREAAQETGMTEPGVKISIHRGMKALTRLISQERTT